MYYVVQALCTIGTVENIGFHIFAKFGINPFLVKLGQYLFYRLLAFCSKIFHFAHSIRNDSTGLATAALMD